MDVQRFEEDGRLCIALTGELDLSATSLDRELDIIASLAALDDAAA